MNINGPIQKGISQNTIDDIIDKTQKVAVKEFAEKLKAKYGKSCSEYYPMLIEMTSDDIDELLKECLND